MGRMALLGSIPACSPRGPRGITRPAQPGSEIAPSVQAPSKKPTFTSSTPSPLFVGKSLAREKGRDDHTPLQRLLLPWLL